MLSALIDFGIAAYQRIGRSFGRRCLFRESCSHYVRRRLLEAGPRGAFQAFRERWARCRPGFHLSWDIHSETFFLHLADGSTLTDHEIADFLKTAPRATASRGRVAMPLGGRR